MSDAEKFTVFDDAEFGIVLQCGDIEIADHFDDFLIDNLDQEIYFKFDAGRVSFFFGKELSVLDVKALFMKFEKDIDSE